MAIVAVVMVPVAMVVGAVFRVTAVRIEDIVKGPTAVAMAAATAVVTTAFSVVMAATV